MIRNHINNRVTSLSLIEKCRKIFNVVSLRAIGALLVCVVLSPAIFGQATGGTISGIVTDSSDAVISGAQVVITQQATGATRTLVTNAEGYFNAPNLSSGIYSVTVSANGFSSSIRKDLQIEVGQSVTANIQLQIGDVSNTVVIEGGQAEVSTTNSVLSNVVEGQAVRDLPINGRDWTQLAALEPGVHTIEAQTSISVGSNGRANRGLGTQLSIGGNRPQQNVYRVDGIIINDYAGSGPGSVLGQVSGVDSIQEFSVITGNASADYGRTSGGVINAVTRAGQNQFRGSLYEFHRNSKFDARNFFDGSTVPPFRRNQFGVSLGGPVYFPRFGEGGSTIYRGNDKTFFFFNYEGLRQNLSSTSINTVPSRAARAGQLTSGNVVVDPRVVPFLNLYPLPNNGENGDFGFYSFVSRTISKEDLFTGRIDHKFSEANNAHFTFMTSSSDSNGPDSYSFVQIGQKAKRRLLSFEDTHIFSQNLLNIARIGYSSSIAQAPLSLNSIDPRASDTSLGFLPGRAVGGIAVSGITTFIGGIDSIATADYDYKSFQLYDDVLYTKGNHSFKFGASFERIHSDEFSATDANGRFIFGSLQAFLTNRPTSFNASIPGASPRIFLRQSVFGTYIQDDYRVRQNLTLNLGLRYEMATVPTEKNNNLSNLSNLTDAQPQVGGPLFNNPTLLNFAPRLGFAWDPFSDGKTAVRGGFGIYDSLPLTYQLALLVVNNAPIFKSGSVTALSQGAFPTAAFTSLTANDLRYSSIERDPKRSYVMQWNLNMQRQLPAKMVLLLGYIGQRGTHMPFRTTDANIVLPTRAADSSLVFPTPRGSGTRLNPRVGTINALAWISSNNYNAMNLRLTRDNKGLRLGFSYTFAKSIDLTSSSLTGANFNNSLVGPFLQFPELTRGLSDFDVRHNMVVNGLWEIGRQTPGSKGASLITNGWQLGGIFRISTGLPFTPVVAGDSLGLKNSAPLNFPDRVNSPECRNPINPGNPTNYIKTECFVAPSVPTRLGNSGRNIAIGPGIKTFDLSLTKNNRFSENVNLQLRAELFNVFNHTNFAVPDRTSSQIFNQNLQRITTAGRLTSTSTSPRQIQLAVKLTF